jgi:omega-6 fatty acid desaturase (delta-12 desaturase)
MNPIQRESNKEWIKIVSRYNSPDSWRSWWQIINSVGSYIILWGLMLYTIRVSYLLTLFLSLIAAGFMVRIFIIFHDCGHGSFFKSEQLCKTVGIITGLIVFTPYHKWHYDKIHHQTVGNLEKRGIGDVFTLTVSEYKNLSPFRRIYYHIYRNPVVLFVIAPILVFTIGQRFTKKYMSSKEKLYVHLSTLSLVAAITVIILLVGWKTFLQIQIPILFVATGHGVWLFYVQHQFRHVLWTNSDNWDYKTIAMKGSSLFKLPPILNWFTGNIGYHHIHHLSPLIPNYKLKNCHNENSMFWDIKPVTFFSAFESLLLRLWDEKRQVLIKFSEV